MFYFVCLRVRSVACVHPLLSQEHKRAARRGSASRDGAQAGGTSAIDAFEAASRSGWLSREQLAANEFVKRVALEHGVGLSAAMMAQRKRKNSSTRKSPEKQQGRKVRKKGRWQKHKGYWVIFCELGFDVIC